MLHWLSITWYFNPKNFKIAQNTWPHIDSASFIRAYISVKTQGLLFYTTSDFLWLNAMYYLHTLWMLQYVDMEYIAFYWITIIQMCLYWKFLIVAVMNVRLGAVMGMVEKMRLVGKMREVMIIDAEAQAEASMSALGDAGLLGADVEWGPSWNFNLLASDYEYITPPNGPSDML